MSIVGIDPGSARSAWIVLTAGAPRRWGLDGNLTVLEALRAGEIVKEGDVVVIEWTAPRGMPASAELFETLWWAGQFAEAARFHPVERLGRLQIKRHLTGMTAAKDSNVRAALIDRFGGVGGKEAAVGRKASPGPLYGITADVWAALAVACTYADQRP